MNVNRVGVISWWLLAATLGLGFHRRPLTKPEPKIPTSVRPVPVGGDAVVAYDSQHQVYVFTYPGYDSKPRKMYFELGTKVDAIVEAAVSQGDKPNSFKYQYTVHNQKNSRQGLGWFVVTSYGDVSTISAPDEGWRSAHLPTPTFPKESGVSWMDSKRREGIPPPPVTEAKAMSSGIPPGRSASGFSFQSELLPGIVLCYAKGWDFIPVTHGEAPGEVDTLVHDNSFLFLSGKTVGPVATNRPTDAVRLLMQLRAWVTEAVDLGWINDANVDTQLVGKIGRAVELAGKPDRIALKRQLLDMLQLAESEKDVHFSSELYCILKYNLKALASSLP